MPSTTTQSTESAPSTHQTTRIAPGHNRCRARTRTGPRCRHHAAPDSPLCSKHALLRSDLPQDTDLSAKFGSQMDDLSTAVHINSFLTTLVQCVVKNEISPRRAAVIGYLTNQIIRTLPAIEHELNPPTGHDSIIFDLPKPHSARATEKHAPYFPTSPNAADHDLRDHDLRDDDPASDLAVATVPHQAATTETNITVQPTTPPTPPPTPTFSRSQHQPNEYPIYRDPNYDDHWFPTGHLIHPQPTTTPSPATPPNPESNQRKPAA
jgi:hypothetical protein